MESILEQNSQGIETLYGSSNVRNKKLRGIKEVAEFICKDGQYGDLTIKRKDGRLFLRTNGIYVALLVFLRKVYVFIRTRNNYKKIEK